MSSRRKRNKAREIQALRAMWDAAPRPQKQAERLRSGLRAPVAVPEILVGYTVFFSQTPRLAQAADVAGFDLVVVNRDRLSDPFVGPVVMGTIDGAFIRAAPQKRTTQLRIPDRTVSTHSAGFRCPKI